MDALKQGFHNLIRKINVINQPKDFPESNQYLRNPQEAILKIYNLPPNPPPHFNRNFKQFNIFDKEVKKQEKCDRYLK